MPGVQDTLTTPHEHTKIAGLKTNFKNIAQLKVMRKFPIPVNLRKIYITNGIQENMFVPRKEQHDGVKMKETDTEWREEGKQSGTERHPTISTQCILKPTMYTD